MLIEFILWLDQFVLNMKVQYTNEGAAAFPRHLASFVVPQKSQKKSRRQPDLRPET